MFAFSKPSWRLAIGLVGFFMVVASPEWALAQKNNRKNDERRENERVKNAENKLDQVKKQVADNDKLIKTAGQNASLAEKNVKVARTRVQDEKEAAESRLDSKSGIPEVVQQLKVARTDFAKIADPIREKVHATQEWKLAEEAATEAKAEKQEVLELVKNLKEREEKLAPLEPLIAKPIELEEKAINEDKAARTASEKVASLKSKLEELRKKFPESKIEEDPLVKKAKQDLAEADKKLQSALREVASLRSKSLQLRKNLAEAQQQLARAKELDRLNK